jgi:hypothetical protein
MKRAVLGLTLLLTACSSDPPTAGSARPSSTVKPTPAPTPAPTSSATPTPTAEPGKDFVVGQQILITWKGADRASKSVTRSKDEAKKLASELLEKAKKLGGAGSAGGEPSPPEKGDYFVELAKQHSDDPDVKERLGNIGSVKRDDGKLPVYQKLFDLKVGELSEVLEAPTGFYLLKRTQ